MKTYTNLEYAKGRLIGTVARVSGKAAHIDALTKTTVTYTDFITGKSELKKIEELDITPVPLGYCNTANFGDNICPYLVRYPVRKWKQGLNHVTLKTVSSHIHIPADAIPWADVFKTINGEFPKFEEAVNTIFTNQNVRAVAYSRDFAVYHDHTVWYKEQFAIGRVLGPKAYDGFVEIDEKFEWVRDAFEASVTWL